MTTRITLSGDTPSKKNSKQIVTLKNGRKVIVSSSHHAKWHRAALKELLPQWKGDPLAGECAVQVTIYPRTKRAGDLSNKAESILDALVDGGVLRDDNWYCVPTLSLCFGGVDKANPRAEIVIYYD